MMSAAGEFNAHPTAEVSPEAQIGRGTRVWNYAQIRERACIGTDVVIGKNVYIDVDVRIGSRCKIQNNASIYHGVEIEDGVFIGPHAILTNDRTPRAITASGELKRADDWTVGRIRICRGASIGAGAIILPNVVIGRFAMIGAGAVVTHDVPAHALVVGNPARSIGWVDASGARVDRPPVDTVP